MSAAWDGVLRSQILDRRRRLQAALSVMPDTAHLAGLLQEVDAALERLNKGGYGTCEDCHAPIEGERLMADPLERLCLGCLTEQQQHALEADLNLAARIQAGLLPREQEYAGWDVRYHYEPAGVVSGDYCDLIARQDSPPSLVFLVGDVSGKGVAAAMLMSHLHAMFRTLVAAAPPVGRLVERANRVFAGSTISTHFATLVCGRASSDGLVQICNAGHCPPLVIRGGKATPVAATGLPIGIFATAEYSCQQFQLEPGDRIAVYTDGLTEARNGAGEEYGEERAAQALSANPEGDARQTVRQCLDSLAAFRGGAPAADDLTVMALHLKA